MHGVRVVVVSLAVVGSMFAVAEPGPATVSVPPAVGGADDRLAPAGLVTSTPGAHGRTPAPPVDLTDRILGLHAPPSTAPAAKTLPGAQALMRRVASLHPCASDDSFLCGKVTVPLDRFGMGTRTIDVKYMVAPHTGPSATPAGAIFATSGGPGNSITGGGGEMYPFRDFVLPQLTDTYDLVFIDQRGVGRSGALKCAGLQHHSFDSYARARSCAKRLGPERNLYGTTAVADDIEDIREDLGYDQIIGMGGSYAGADWVTYAVRHSAHTESLMLASPAPPLSTEDPFDSTSAKALPGYPVRACRRSTSCSREFEHPRRQIVWLLHRLRQQPVSGRGYDFQGDPVRVRVTEGTLAWRIMFNADFPFFYAELPAAAAALRHGDEKPLLRLAATHEPPPGGFDEGPFRDFSMGAALARICVDDSYVWDEDAPSSVRRRQFAEAKADQPRRFGLLSTKGWIQSVPLGFMPSVCIANRWEHRATWKPGTRVGGVPTLILTGDIDNGLPTGISRRAARVLTDSTLVEVEQAGHNPYFWRECARKMVRAFIARGNTHDLCAGKPFVKHWEPGSFARRAADAPAARSASPKDESTRSDRKLATVAVWTLLDSIQQVINSGTQKSRGLRGGRVTAEFPGFPTPDVYRLHRTRFTNDVAVTGKGYWDFDNGVGGDFRLHAPGVDHAKLHIKGHWYLINPGQTLVRGRIDGRHIEVEVAR